MRFTASTKSGGNCPGASRRRKVTFASALLATTAARTSSPPVRTTPAARPFSTRMRDTDASQRISPPRARAAEAAQAALQSVHSPQAAQAGTEQVRRRLSQCRLDHVGDALQHRLVARVVVGVAPAELGDFLVGQLGVRTKEKRATVRKGSERRRAAFEHLEAVLVQAQVADDFLAKETVD